MKPGRDHWWHELMANASRRMPRRAARQLSIRSTSSTPRARPANRRDPAHHRRLLCRHVRSPPSGSSTSRKTTSTGAPPTSAGSPATATSSTARCPTARRRDVRRRAQHSEAGSLLGHHREVQVNIFYTAPTAIRAFIKWGDRVAEEARPGQPASAGHGRRADQSRGVDVVPRSHRRRTAAPSSIRGGRPKPARS